MSPLADRRLAVGHDVWLQTCLAYAQQQQKRGELHSAASYYLCCNRVHEAVRAYVAAGYYACVARSASLVSSVLLLHGLSRRHLCSRL